MRKKNKMYLGVGVLFSIIILIGVFASSGLMMQSFDASKIYAQPNIGSLCCERDDTKLVSVPITHDEICFLGICNEYTEAIDVCSGELDPMGCDYQVKIGPAGFDWLLGRDVHGAVKTETGQCYVGYPSTDSGAYEGCYPDVVLAELSSNWQTVLVHVPVDSKVYLRSMSDMVVQKSFTPYILNYKGGTGGEVPWNVEGCRVEKTNPTAPIDMNQLIVSETLQSYQDVNAQYYFHTNDQIPFGRCVNFIESWQLSPIQFAPTLNGQKVACQLGGVYNIGTITFLDGSTLQVVDKQIATYGSSGTYQCCPGMGDATKVCTADWKWESKDTAQVQCSSEIQCQIAGSSSLGNWQLWDMRADGCTIAQGACVNGYCDYKATTKEVACCYNGQCSGDKPVCDIGNTWTCVASVSGATILPPEGNENSGNASNLNWLWGLLAGIVAFLIYSKKSLKNIKKNWVDVVIGIIIGIFVGYIVYWILVHLTGIIFGGILGTILGGVLLYFFGPAILAVVVVMMAIVSAIRGK